MHVDFDKALESALAFLGEITPAGATARLRDIDVEEVSFVDRAANKRRFLAVKRRGDPKMKIKLSEAIKATLLEKLAMVLDKVVSVSDVVKNAEVSAEATVPDTLVDDLNKSIGLAEAVVLAVVPKDDPTLVDIITDVSTSVDKISTMVGEGNLPEDVIPSAKNLVEKLVKLFKEELPASGSPPEVQPEPQQPPTPTGKADPMVIDIEVMSDDEFMAQFDAAEKELGGVFSEFTDKMKVIAQAILRIVDAPDPVSLNNIRRDMLGALDAVKAMAGNKVEDAPTADDVAVMLQDLAVKVVGATKQNVVPQVKLPPKEGGDLGNIGNGPTGDAPAKDISEGVLGDILKSIVTLNKKVDRVASIPAVPTSRSEGGHTKDEPPVVTPPSPRKRKWVA